MTIDVNNIKSPKKTVPITEQIWTENTEPLVSISCITYNHENYIRDAIEGFLMQKTTFPVEILIHDDASTDKTASIVREYEKKYRHLIKPIYQTENQYSKKDGTIGRIQRGRARGIYYAVCEGDDYWTDPLKLQKQVDFLEENPEYGLVGSDFDILNQKTNILEESLYKNMPGIFPIYTNLEDFILGAGFMAPCTWLFRKELTPKNTMNHIDGSFALLLHFFAESKVHVLHESTAVYRKLEESASHSKSKEKLYKREFGILKTKLEYHKKYSLSNELQLKIIKRHYHLILPAAIALNQEEDIQKAKELLRDDKTKRNKLLFFIAKISFGDKIINILYLLKKLRKSFFKETKT